MIVPICYNRLDCLRATGQILAGGCLCLDLNEGAITTTMPKLKTHKGAAKRLKTTGTGKILRMKGLRGHLRRNRAPRAKEMYGKMLQVSPADEKRLKRLIPYGSS